MDLQYFFIAIVLLVLFMAPTWIAHSSRRWSVGLVNVFLGWTLIFWFVALVMAVRSQEANPETKNRRKASKHSPTNEESMDNDYSL